MRGFAKARPVLGDRTLQSVVHSSLLHSWLPSGEECVFLCDLGLFSLNPFCSLSSTLSVKSVLRIEVFGSRRKNHNRLIVM